MELEEMQTAWTQLSDQLDNQKKLTNQIIMEMTQERYRSKIGIFMKYEGMGSIICFAAAIMLLFHMEKMDTWYLLVSGIFTIAYLFFMPVIVLRSIRGMQRINLVQNTYKETLVAYAKKKKEFLLTQRLGIYFNFILLMVSLPVVIKVFKGKDIFITHTEVLYWYLPIMLVFLLLFSLWGYSKYKQVAAAASKILETYNENEN